jgi:hypothetical protein
MMMRSFPAGILLFPVAVTIYRNALIRFTSTSLLALICNYKYGILAVILTGPLWAQNGSSVQIPADKGALSNSGKFQPKDPSGTPAPDPRGRLAELGIKLDGEKVQIGLVQLDRKTRAVSFPAKVHAKEGIIEYVVVHAKGKVHETLFVTDALPHDIHLACLLAGWGNSTLSAPSPVIIEASWETNGPPRCEPIENLVAFAKDHPQAAHAGRLASGAWTYQGSIVDSAGFAATREGSIISVINDPAALAGNPRPGSDDDTLHVPNAALLPQPGIPVRITLRPAPVPTQPSSKHTVPKNP